MSPRFWLYSHGIITLIWLALIAPTLLWWLDSVPWLVLMSLWANIASHAAAWQASRAERANGG